MIRQSEASAGGLVIGAIAAAMFALSFLAAMLYIAP